MAQRNSGRKRLKHDRYETPEWVRYDGVQVETEPGGSGRQVYGFYGGQTVHYWESSPEGDGLHCGEWNVHGILSINAAVPETSVTSATT